MDGGLSLTGDALGGDKSGLILKRMLQVDSGGMPEVDARVVLAFVSSVVFCVCMCVCACVYVCILGRTPLCR